VAVWKVRERRTASDKSSDILHVVVHAVLLSTSKPMLLTITITLLVIAGLFPSSYSLSNSKRQQPNFQDIVSKMRADLTLSAQTKEALSSSSNVDASPPSCVAQEARSLKLFSTTPLIHSAPLSRLCHPHPVYLKLDLLQPSGSFKDRGMAHLCTTVQKMHNIANGENSYRMKVISSSGGNAGLAVTTVARNIPQMDVTVIVPETTKPLVVEKLRALGAEVTIHGKNWNEADALARQLVDDAKKSGGGAVYVSPYDNPLLWTGHSTVIDEIITQLLEQRSTNEMKIGAILASVGGGGLLCGVLEGIERNYHGSNESRSKLVRGTKVLACETEGAASFAASFNSPDGSLIRLDGINSIATSLGALEVTPAVIQRSRRHRDRGEISNSGDDVISYVCTDIEAVQGCVQFSSDHRMLVEPACGASLAPLYSDRLRNRLLSELKDNEDSVIVVEVCGGSGVNLNLLIDWMESFVND